MGETGPRIRGARRAAMGAPHAYLPSTAAGSESESGYSSRSWTTTGRPAWVGRRGRGDPTRVLAVSSEPSLDVGGPGQFDDNGVNPLSVFRRGDRIWLYYAGWQRGMRLPYLLFTGLAFSDDDGAHFSGTRAFQSSTARMPSRRCARAFVMPRDSGFRAGTGRRQLGRIAGTADPATTCATSSPPTASLAGGGEPCIHPRAPDEYGFGRPTYSRRKGACACGTRCESRAGIRLGYASRATDISGSDGTRS